MLLKVLITTLLILKFTSAEPKNVIIITADDLGFNDVSYHGSTEIPTYNIDALAYNGIILNNFRTPPLCTPSRSALMTGKYPHHTGMQHYVIANNEPWGLPLNETIMPQYFKQAGYVTRMIGKWHLGFFKEDYVPTNRGYDSFFGYYGAAIDYWDYTATVADYSRGYDLRRNTTLVEKSATPKYATEMFTEEAVNVIKSHDKSKPLFLVVNELAPHAGNEDDPMQAKQEDIERFTYIKDEKRRTLAAMIYQLDKSVGAIVKALKENSMLDNSIVVFYSDNGGPSLGFTSTAASNFPLRGQKFSGWEGSIRTNAIVYAKNLPRNVVRNRMFYIADWLPTLKTLSGANFKITAKIDGIDQTNMLKGNTKLRNELVTLDDVFGFSSYILNEYKLLNGSSSPDGEFDDWLGTNDNVNQVDPNMYFRNVTLSDAGRAINSTLTAKTIDSIRQSATLFCTLQKCEPCDLLKGPCLFNIEDDPCEQNNLAGTEKAMLKTMQKKLAEKMKFVVPARNQPADPKSDPKNFDNTWSPWQ